MKRAESGERNRPVSWLRRDCFRCGEIGKNLLWTSDSWYNSVMFLFDPTDRSIGYGTKSQ